jgi:hypothetical protein
MADSGRKLSNCGLTEENTLSELGKAANRCADVGDRNGTRLRFGVAWTSKICHPATFVACRKVAGTLPPIHTMELKLLFSEEKPHSRASTSFPQKVTSVYISPFLAAKPFCPQVRVSSCLHFSNGNV